MDLLRTLMRMIKNYFQLDAPALPEKEAEILSHGCLFSWLEQGAAQGPITLGLDLDGFQVYRYRCRYGYGSYTHTHTHTHA
jgi:hypothetical protein